MDRRARIRRAGLSPKILLKARPVADQLRDRLASPIPDGLELYLDLADVSQDDWLKRSMSACDGALSAVGLSAESFTIITEGPLRSLDGRFFDLTDDSPGNRELIRRLVAMSVSLGARALNVHAIAPRHERPDLSWATREVVLEAALPLLRFYVDRCLEARIRPLVENIPPIARMRESSFVYTPIGMAPEDLAWLASRVDGLGFTLDVSHAQLYLNALAGRTEDAEAHLQEYARAIATSALESAATLGIEPPVDLIGYAAILRPNTVSLHVSNASGLLGEGSPYGQGDADLDASIAPIMDEVCFVVTETLEPDQSTAIFMREAQSRLIALRAEYRQTRSVGDDCRGRDYDDDHYRDDEDNETNEDDKGDHEDDDRVESEDDEANAAEGC